jgi:hypothetical protein
LNPAFHVILDPAEALDITASRYSAWRGLVEVGGYLIWNREGAVRRVSTAVLANALNLYENTTYLIDAGPDRGDAQGREANQLGASRCCCSPLNKPPPKHRSR